MINGNDDDIFVVGEVTLEDQIESLTNHLNDLQSTMEYYKSRSELHFNALQMLIKLCHEKGFNVFPDIPVTKLMTTDEIIERNKQVQLKKQVPSDDAITKQPTIEELTEMYKLSPEGEKSINTLLGLLYGENDEALRSKTRS